MVESKKYTSTQTGKTYPITEHMDCKSTWVVYLITCCKCKKQYIGKTVNKLYTRISNTRSQIKNFNTPTSLKLPYAQHFNLPGHSIADLSLMPIEKIRKPSNQTILHRESFLIAKLKTLKPNGINADE
jgi:tripartite motif-containing protein 2/3